MGVVYPWKPDGMPVEEKCKELMKKIKHLIGRDIVV
jgi:hypothetical protein